jgi:hypothetical protein
MVPTVRVPTTSSNAQRGSRVIAVPFRLDKLRDSIVVYFDGLHERAPRPTVGLDHQGAIRFKAKADAELTTGPDE